MLPLYDVDLDTQAYNIFQPVKSILPYELPKLSITVAEIQPTKVTKPATFSFKKPEVDLYCKACKKKFSNEPTFTNHLKSAKHIANEKKMQPAKAAPSPRIAVNPQVQEALAQLERAQDPKCDPTMSITIYWNQAQILFVLKRPQYTEKALKSLIQLILSSPTTTFSSAQITSFLYNSRLSLARLLCIYQNLDESRSVYLDALDGKWKLEKTELLSIAQRLREFSITSLITACDTLATKYLTRERTRVKPAPQMTDINNSITTILNEAGNLFAQENDTFNTIPSEHIAIVLYATCSLVCQYDKVEGFTPNDFYSMMNQVYESLDDLTHHMIEINLLDKTNAWNIFNALLLSIEIDDLVRANNIYKNLKQNEGYLYPDVKLLCDLCESKLTLNYYNLQHDLNYIKLLLTESNEPLLIRNRTQTDQMYTLDRITDLI
ncbi:hypothetical protein BD770DRAFT_447247 [Pilaira anomala]|nr:hypothetical protein BD770DRAFT_447247 [Pilaira anomala]